MASLRFEIRRHRPWALGRSGWHGACLMEADEDDLDRYPRSMPLDEHNDPNMDDTVDPHAAPRDQQTIESLRQGRLDSTFIDVSRQGPPLSEDEFLDESGD